MPGIVILGGGGHARSLIDCLQAAGRRDIHGILTHDRTQWGGDVLGVPVLGGDDLLPQLVAQGITRFIVGVGSVGSTVLRQKLAGVAHGHGMYPVQVIHPQAVCAASAKLGDGVQVFAGAIINAVAMLGAHVVVNTGTVIEHDCEIADHVFMAPRACLCGNVKVEIGAHIGPGAIIREGVTIGKGAIVGAGAVVVKPVPAYTLVMGVPARPVRRVNQTETG
jgi:sugar O-acyltransferase (sialic acid O-acetyltransferase NeuD family)